MNPLSSSSTPSDPSARAARIAVSVIFFINGFGFASWVPHIPTVQTRLGLSPSHLGLALLAMAAGALASMPLSGAMVARFGSRAMTMGGSVLFCALVALPVRATDFVLLVASLLVLGAANGTMDVSMNAHAVAVEKRLGRPVMSSFHALYSLGGLAGSGSSILWLSLGLTPPVHMTGVAVLCLVSVLGASRFLLAEVPEEQGATGQAFMLPRGPVLTLGLLTFMVMMVEGGMADWSAVYLRQSLGAEVGLAGAGYAVFSLAMATGRLTGDWLTQGLGPATLLRVGGALATCGLGGALLLHHPVAALVGFGCVGLGLSNLVPVLFSAAGRMPGLSPGVGIAAVSTTGYGGFLVGPPLVGFLAEQTGLPLALGLFVLFLALVALNGARVRPSPAG